MVLLDETFVSRVRLERLSINNVLKSCMELLSVKQCVALKLPIRAPVHFVVEERHVLLTAYPFFFFFFFTLGNRKSRSFLTFLIDILKRHIQCRDVHELLSFIGF